MLVDEPRQLSNVLLRPLTSKKIYIFKNEGNARWAFSTIQYERDKKVISGGGVGQMSSTSEREREREGEMLFTTLFRNFL